MSDTKPQPSAPATPDAAPEARFEWSQSPFESFLENHFRKLLIGLLLIAAGVGTWLVMRQRSERNATEQAQAFTSSETLDDFKKVIANHPGTVAAGSAQLMIANLLAQNNDVAGALEEFKKFTAAFPQHPMIDHAAFRTAVLTAEKDGPEAGVAQYESFIEKFPNSPFRPLAQMRKADTLVTLGKRDEALALYDAIQKDNTLYANTVLTDAKERAAQVKLQPPTEVEYIPDPDPPAPSPGAPTIPGLDFDLPAPSEPPLGLDPAPAPDAPASETPTPETSTPETSTPETSAPEAPASEAPSPSTGQ